MTNQQTKTIFMPQILSRKQQRAINLLKAANERIFAAEMLIADLNTKGHQFDYCTHPELSSLADGIKIKADHINNIVYQEKE